jgi:adenylate cyclase class IV
VELEIIVNTINDDITIEEVFVQGKKKLLDFLDSLGIKREAIESRFYSDMLNSAI